MSEKAGLKPRRAASLALHDWENGKGFLGELLAQQSQLSEGERALAMDLCMGICRQKLLLDHQIQLLCPKSPQPLLRQILRVGIYQLAFMKDEIPAYSAVDTAVELASTLVSKAVRGFANAILRRFDREGLQVPTGNNNRDWSIRYSHPQWLVAKWRREIGDALCLERLQSGLELPAFWLRRNPAKIDLQTWRNLDLHQEEYWERFGRTHLPLRQVLQSDAFRSGQISLQDPSSWLMTRLLPLDQAPMRILDACAAPGGKTALMLEEYPQHQIISCDLKPHRLARMGDLSTRLDLHPDLVCQDGLRPAFAPASFDALLLDAPCSNLGVLGRRPEARWGLNEQDLLAQADLQSRLLQSLCDLVKIGGTLVYGTCSPESEETTQVVQDFLDRNPHFALAELPQSIEPQWRHRGMMRVIPTCGGFDGFFGAALVRRA